MNNQNHKNQTTDIAQDAINAIARIGSWEFNLETQLFTLNQISCDILEIPQSTLNLAECSSYFEVGSFTTQIKKGIDDLIAKKIPFDQEIELITSLNKTIWVHMIGNGTFSENICLKISGIFQDITKRKAFEKKLLQKNELLNFTEKKASLGHWKLDLNTDMVTCSQNICRIIGVEEDTPITIDMMINSVHPEDINMVRAHFKKSLKNNIFETLHHRYLLKDGTERIIQVLGEFIADEAGNFNNVLFISQDITARKQFEEGLMEKNQLFSVIKRMMKLGYWLWDLRTNVLTCSENMSNLLELEHNEGLPAKTLLKNVHPDDLENLHAYLEEVILTKTFKSFSHRIIIDGVIRYIQVNGKVNIDKNGEALTILGISQDVTAQKDLEIELQEKNRLLNFAEEKAGVGHWRWIINEDLFLLSKSLFKIFGIPEGTRITSETLLKYVHPEDRKKVEQAKENAIKNKEFIDVIHRIILDDGTLKYLNATGGDLITNDKGELIEVRGAFINVTKQQKEILKFKGLLESAPNATLIIGQDSIIQMINKQAEKLFGYTPKELVGQSIDMLIPSRFLKKRAPIREVFFNNPKVMSIDIDEDYYLINKKGKEIPVKVSIGPLQADDGLLISMAIWDITAEKLAEHKMLESNERLEILAKKLTAQNQQLADFTQITSHNLRAPVSNLNSIVSLYKTSNREEERSEIFSKFEIVIGHLTLTLNTLVETLKTKSEKSVIRKEVSFTQTLKKTQDILMAQISDSGALIKGDFSAIDVVSYNPIYMESIFQNLIGNAIKYKDPERNPEIIVTSEIENGVVKLSFKDNGLGIDLKKHGHKLFGLNKVFHRHPDAKGVGLFMTKAQVEAMGGKISAESQVGKGSIFSIEF
ncbi:PAS domain S-box protein [uncultured Kriegella sp.]|uniref:PAS domain-containing sensor histidine kinase n=1 Tax=uncultured Kriegella sp. TaxID=1798910 RepID=UPI0030D8462E|tara:strand:+ start:141740 stop:144358 length:2619 start_codon:yes stop_codon:yes gene_type:complete